MYELSIKSDFASAHFLKGYDGPCATLHGHTWKVRVTFMSKELNDIGLVVDFCEIKRQFKEFLKRIDHVNLNELEAFQKTNPSSENLARYIYEEFGRECSPLKIKSVTVWESDTSSVKYYE